MKKAVIFGVFIFLIIFTFSKIPNPSAALAQTAPSCSSLAMTLRTNIISKTTVNVTAGQSVHVVANIINDNNVRNNSTWNATGGTYQSKNWDYATWIAPTTPGDYVITYALSGLNQANCTATFRVPSLPPTCTGIKTSTNTPLDSLQSSRSYTFVGNNCQNATSYQWVMSKGSCSTATFPATGTGTTQALTMPTYSYAGQSCSFTIGLKVCNAANQCSQYYSQNPIVKYAPPVDARQWTFNVTLSCQNGATPVNTTTNTSWNFLNSAGSSSCQPNAGESRGNTRTTLTFSETFTSAPSLCSQGIFNISKIAEGEAAAFKDASSSLITAKANDPGTVTWPIASLPAGTYAVNYYLPPSSCPTPSITPRPSPCNGIGDVNNDGLVTEADALLLLRQVAGLETFTNEQKRRANVNGDSLIDTSDALFIRRYIAGIDSTFPACTASSPQPTVCDPDPTLVNGQRVINNQDLAVIRNELLGLVVTNKGACLNNAPDNTASSTTNNTALARIRNILLGLENFQQ